MNLLTFAKLGAKHVRSDIAEMFYLNTGIDKTLPVTFYAVINEHCNAKCRYCDYWRLKHYHDELTIEQWQDALLSIKQLVGQFSINFSGGEPFLKKGFIDLFKFCAENSIHMGVTTNGSALTAKNAQKIVTYPPLNINISFDAPNAEVHDYLRGYKGLFDKMVRGVAFLREEQEKQQKHFPIVLKYTVNSGNFRHMPEFVHWANEIGATAVSFQPVGRWTKETYDELWIEEKDWAELDEVMQELVSLQEKKEGAPITNSPQTLRLFVAHFREEKAPKEVMPCRVGMRNYFIDTQGNVGLCLKFPQIGNVTESSAYDIWYGQTAQQVRRDTTKCEELCLITCLSQKTLKDKLHIGRILLSN